jgi:hypothetical protein
MKNLTVAQKEIVNNLVNEFSKLNETKSVGEFSLLNYNALNIEKNRQLKAISELKAHNESMKALIKNVADDIAKKLNCDISRGNLPIKAVVNCNDTIYIQHIKDFSFDCSRDVLIYIAPIFESAEFGEKIIGHKFSHGYSSHTYYKYQTIGRLHCYTS